MKDRRKIFSRQTCFQRFEHNSLGAWTADRRAAAPGCNSRTPRGRLLDLVDPLRRMGLEELSQILTGCDLGKVIVLGAQPLQVVVFGKFGVTDLMGSALSTFCSEDFAKDLAPRGLH